MLLYPNVTFTDLCTELLCIELLYSNRTLQIYVVSYSFKMYISYVYVVIYFKHVELLQKYVLIYFTLMEPLKIYR